MMTLLSPYTLNSALTLKNRVVMAPMTRALAGMQGIPTVAMRDYYARRAAAGLIVTEGTVISRTAVGFQGAPGIYSPEQIDAWRHVTNAVHQRNGLIFCQIWHVGRVSHPDFLQGQLPISSSKTAMTGSIARGNGRLFGESRAASFDDIALLIALYAQAAENAMLAGFDGIELHGANGYLIDQFLHHNTNHRDDVYGGSPDNMARFALEVVQACGDAIGYERVGVRLSPGGYLNQIVGDVRDAAVFSYLLQQLANYPIAYVHTGNFNDSQIFSELGDMSMTAFMRVHYHGTLVACGGYTIETATTGIASDEFDLVAFGRPFIANPDLISRIEQQHPLFAYETSMLNQLI